MSNAATITSNLWVQGPTSLSNTVDVSGRVNLSNATTITSNLWVQGATSLSNNLNVFGSMTVSNIATLQSNLVVAGTATVSNATLVLGPTSLSNTMDVSGRVNLSNATTITSNLWVQGATSLSNNLNVFGSMTVSNVATLQSNLIVAGTATVSNVTLVLGGTSLSNTLDVSGLVNLSNAATITSNLWVQGATSLSNNLNVFGSMTVSNVTTLQSNLVVAGTATVSNATRVLGPTSLSNTLDVSGRVNLSNAATITSNLWVQGATSLSNNLNVFGFMTVSNVTALQSNLVVAGTATVSNATLVLGPTSLNNTLDVSGRVNLNSNLLVMGAATHSNFIRTTSNIHVDQRIGVGTTTPEVALEIRSTDAILIPKGTTAQRPSAPNTGHIRYNTQISQFEGFGAGDAWGSLGGVQSTDQQTFVRAEMYPTSNDGNIRFVNNSTESMRITSTRDVGIATTAPTERVDIAGNLKVRDNAYIMSNLGVGTSNPQNTVDIVGSAQVTGTFVTVGSCIIRKGQSNNVVTSTVGWSTASDGGSIYTLSNVGIGTNNPTYPLHVMSHSNNVSIFAQYGVTQFSDFRIKENLKPITNALDKVNNITGYTFNRLDGGDNSRFAGVIAQEVEKVLPEVVHYDYESQMYGVSYGEMVALLVEAIKELKTKCEEQDRRIKALETSP
jgi:acyl-[acyl carrier protein]--UDP-N-acetylglucosamine O-acyltransferase